MNLTALGTSCKWNHAVGVLLSLAYFLSLDVLKVHPGLYHVTELFSSLRLSTIPLYVYTPQSVYPFMHGWLYRLCSPLGFCE